MNEYDSEEEIDEAEGVDSASGDDEEPASSADPFAGLYASFQAELAARARKYGAYLATPGYERDLRRAYESLASPDNFKPGDVVQWKTFMRESRLPEYGAPAIVVALGGAFQDTKRAQQAFPPHDLLLAVLDGDQDFVTFSASSARLTFWESDIPQKNPGS